MVKERIISKANAYKEAKFFVAEIARQAVDEGMLASYNEASAIKIEQAVHSIVERLERNSYVDNIEQYRIER